MATSHVVAGCRRACRAPSRSPPPTRLESPNTSRRLDSERFRPLPGTCPRSCDRLFLVPGEKAPMLNMRRREFMEALAGAAAWPLAAHAQQSADKLPLIAVLIAGSEAAYRRDLESFRGGMRQLGYSDGENIRYEYRFADG